MQIILRGPAAGYEAEHTARIFFPAPKRRKTCRKPRISSWRKATK